MKIGFCTMEKFDNRLIDSVGSSRIRARWLIKYWPEAEEFIIGSKYDVLIFQKVYWDKMMYEFDGIKILDICDPDWLEGKPVFEYVDLAHATVVSSPALRDYMLKIRPKAKIVFIPDRVDMDYHKRKEKHEGELKDVVWFGYSQNIHYVENAFDQLIQKNISITIISDQPYNPPYQYQALKFKNIPYSFPNVNYEIIKSDAVLLPQGNDLRGRFKSDNKVTTSWALGMPVIQVPEDLDYLKSAENRQIEADKRYKEVLQKWVVQRSVEEYKELIESVKKA